MMGAAWEAWRGVARRGVARGLEGGGAPGVGPQRPERHARAPQDVVGADLVVVEDRQGQRPVRTGVRGEQTCESQTRGRFGRGKQRWVDLMVRQIRLEGQSTAGRSASRWARARKAAYGGGSRKRNSSVSFHFGASVFARQVELRFCPPHLRVWKRASKQHVRPVVCVEEARARARAQRRAPRVCGAGKGRRDISDAPPHFASTNGSDEPSRSALRSPCAWMSVLFRRGEQA